MIIDFHTHTFPSELAFKTIPKLAQAGNIVPYTDGTKPQLIQSMKESAVDYSVLLPIATRPTQTEKLNRLAAETNQTTEETGLLSFGTLHPDNEDYKEQIRQIADYGIKGVKLHPCYQDLEMDDIRMLRIVYCIQEYGLITIFHAGYDVGFPGCRAAMPERCLHLIEEIHPRQLVLAHMGGWGCWDEVSEKLAGLDVWFDTAFSIGEIRSYTPNTRSREESQMLTETQLRKLVRKHGADRVLFGTDSPWGSQQETLEKLEQCGFTEKELKMIKGENAARLLNL